jgi:hypothetical protein
MLNRGFEDWMGGDIRNPLPFVVYRAPILQAFGVGVWTACGHDIPFSLSSRSIARDLDPN